MTKTVADFAKPPENLVETDKPQGYNGSNHSIKQREMIVSSETFLDSEGKIDWTAYAPNKGYAQGTSKLGQTLGKGVIIDRYGSELGFFTSPEGTTYEQRSLPYIENPHTYHKYEVLRNIDSVTVGEIAAAFGQPGGGIQYELPYTITELIQKGYIKEIEQ